MSKIAWAATAGIATTLTGVDDHRPTDWAGAFDAAPALHWMVELPGKPFPAAVHTELGGPLLHGDHIFLGQASTDALFVLERHSGRMVRRIPTGAPVQSTPVIVDGKLLIADLSGQVQLFRLDEVLGDGDAAPIWSKEGASPVLSSPTVHDGRVYVADVSDVVVSLGMDSGELIWRHAQRLDPGRSTELELYGAPAPLVLPATADEPGVVVAGFTDGTLAALTIATGEVEWQRRVGEGQYPDVLGQALSIGDDLVVSGYTEPLVAIHRKSRNVRWRVDVGGAQRALAGGGSGGSPAPTFGNADDAYVFHGGVDGKMRCVDARTGNVIWTWDSKTTTALTRPVPTEAGLMVAASGGTVALVDPTTGAEQWRWSPTFHVSGITTPPAVDGRQAVVVTNAGHIVSFVVPEDEPAFQRGDAEPQRWQR